MVKLIKLEWKKNHVTKYIMPVLISVFLAGLFVFALDFLGLARDPDTGVVDAVNSNIGALIELLTNMIFLVFTGTMLASFIVSAYQNKTMNLMFSYPIKRQKILVSQMAAVWIFNVIALIAAKLCLYGIIFWYSGKQQPDFATDFNMLEGGFYLHMIVGSVATVTLGFIALFVGMRKKSVKATIITSFLLIVLTQGSVGDFTLANNILLPILLMTTALIFSFLSVYNAETKDLM